MNDLMVDGIVAQGGTKMGSNIRFATSPHASRSFGLKSDYLSLHHRLTRQSAEIQAELLKMVRESIAPVVCRKEASLLALATEDQFRGDSFQYHALYHQ